MKNKKKTIDHSQFDKDWSLATFGYQLCFVEATIKILRECYDNYVAKCTGSKDEKKGKA